MSVQETSSSDLFFYYGTDVEKECESELLNLVMNPRGAMMYNRRYGAGASDFENYPNGFSMQVVLRYQIADAVAYRNSTVTDGSNNTIDRRIAVSQNFISFIPNNGELDINILYFLYSNYSTPRNLSMPIPRTS
jgi:hypothetical protein